MFTRTPGGRAIANARRRDIVEFTGDPYGEARGRALAGEIAGRMQGAGTAPKLGDRGDPTVSFGGYAPSPQRFVSAAPVVGRRPAAGTIHDANPTIDTGRIGDNPYADPAARIFAQRLARRT